MRDVLQTRPRRMYGSDRSNGACIVYADPADPRSGRVWPNALPPHLSGCRIDAGKGLRQHRCSVAHRAVVDGYRAWRETEELMAEAATHGYATELAEYWSTHGRPTFGAYLRGLARTGDMS
jgi:hypothetical protein